MKSLLLIVLMLSAGSWAQEIPAGTILPVELNSSLRSNKAKPGDVITGRIMQDVWFGSRERIRAGSRIVGHVVTATPAHGTAAGELSVRFDTLVRGKQRIAIVTNLRALATMMEVSEAQVPESGPDRGTPENMWTTDQIGGEVDYHGGMVSSGAELVGRSTPDGALVHLHAKPGMKCRGDFAGDDRLQSLWVFSSDACGLYGFPLLSIRHAGRSDPVGEIRLLSDKGNVHVGAGSGILLRVDGTEGKLAEVNPN